METFNTEQVIKTIAKMCDIIIENEVPFCELDSAAGDGDFGMSLAKGFKVVKEEFANHSRDDIGAFLKDCGMIITEHCGGASGPIWGSGFRAMGKYAAGKSTINLVELAEMVQSSIDAVQKRGGAKLGDKTLLDALIPATESLKASGAANETFAVALAKSADAAVAGGEATKLIAATKGRASYVGDRSISFPDAGATAISIIFRRLLA